MKEQKNNKAQMLRLLELSKQLVIDCSLENGGIVAANSTKKYFPASAKNYFYVWPRDAAYACLAANMTGMKEIAKNFFIWCLDHAEDFKNSGLFYEKYYPNGLKASFNFQPDQTGTLLVAIHDYCKRYPDESNDPGIRELITLAANGICSIWNGRHFTLVTNDLWEERFCFPELEENFTYSLAACISGLRGSNEIIPEPGWEKTAEEMQGRLDNHFEGYFFRSYGKLSDRRIDASLLGLVYPFKIYEADDPVVISTVTEIAEKLVIDGGVHRYEHDEYDGWMKNGIHMNKGAGSWPLLNFWLSIYYSIKNDHIKAKNHYDWVLSNLKDSPYIPEQIFTNKLQVSVSPLLWSHTMFLIASRYLKLV